MAATRTSTPPATASVLSICEEQKTDPRKQRGDQRVPAVIVFECPGLVLDPYPCWSCAGAGSRNSYSGLSTQTSNYCCVCAFTRPPAQLPSWLHRRFWFWFWAV